jgi:hypothetical protein
MPLTQRRNAYPVKNCVILRFLHFVRLVVTFNNFFLNKFGPKPLFLFFNKQTMHIKPMVCTRRHCYVFSKNLMYTLAGYEPGPSGH